MAGIELVVNDSSRFFLSSLLAGGVFFAPGVGLAEPAPPPSYAPSEHVWVMTKRPLTDEQTKVFHGLDRLLIMVPGISSGDLEENRRFLDRIRIRGGYEVAVFYHWEAWNPSRKVVSPTATTPAAQRLVKLCETFQAGSSAARPIDLLAHSAGTAVVNKAAEEIMKADLPVRFRHVLFLGTALDADEPLDALQTVSASVLNVHSAYDKVNRNINDRLGMLSSLKGGPYRNLRMDHSLGGRIMRHYVFLSSNPENWIQYGTYLSTGQWPEPKVMLPSKELTAEELHRLALWVKAHPDGSDCEIEQLVPELIARPNTEVTYYGIILAGLLKMRQLAPAIEKILDDGGAPVPLRKDIYQALGNLEDGQHVYFLREARKLDPACDEEIRDVARELKRKRIRPVRADRRRERRERRTPVRKGD